MSISKGRKLTWIPCFLSNKKLLANFKEDSLLLFSLDLRFGIEDFTEVASNSLIDGSSDKKIDLLYIDKDSGIAVVAQTYMSLDWQKREAPANKASDLNTAASWLLARPIDDLPESIKSHVEELRTAIKNNLIKSLYFWYVHNLPESKNVKEELRTVEHTANTLLKTHFPDCGISEVQAIEVGNSVIEEWYKSLSTPILVTDKFEIPVSGGYEIYGTDWNAYITAIPAKWLYEKYNLYKDTIFSANVRGYLGSRKKDDNINFGIKKTGSEDPEHFWVFNNGITALVYDFKLGKEKKDGNAKINFKGFSIVNGAQTTGAIGSLESPPSDAAKVQVRFVVCSKIKTIQNIVRYNNSQNKIAAPDFRSSDSVQTRLVNDFLKASNLEYLARRGGSEDIIKRKKNVLPSITAGQALAALHGDPEIAYNQKSDIWESDVLYSKYFNEQTMPQHVFFAYSLLEAIEKKKLELIHKSRQTSLTKSEDEQLSFLRLRGSIILFASALSSCLEIFLSSSIPNLFRVCFSKKISLDEAVKIWDTIIDVGIPFNNVLKDGLSDGLKNSAKINNALNTFRSLMDSTKIANSAIFTSFANKMKK